MGFELLNKKLLKTALAYDGDDEKRIKNVEYLIRIGADVNVKDEAGIPLIIRLQASDKHEVISKILIENKADVNETNRSWKTALMVASEYGSLNMVDMLIGAGARVSSCDRQGWSALYFAAYNGRADVVELLIKNGADVNAKSYGNDCCSPLMACCWGWRNNDNYKKCIKILLDNGADIDVKNKNRLSVVDYAKEAKNDELLKLFKEEKSNRNVGMSGFFKSLFER